ncbi:helix-turn-helix domain-containing protein [Harryflintia acetispora]|uniref:helix-turn-helix domain-containing protein n=1 Tax=Harryflintia acetispora TaxID=1849041 RepID=UPI00104A2DF1|nr:helix-turn-helix transcriptional regulator [Harryflintia acetispora]
MTLFERIENSAKKEGITIGKLERLCGFSNGTIRKWRTQKPTLEKVMIVADQLNVGIQYLATGKENIISTPSLSDGDQEVLKLIENLSEKDKYKIAGALQVMIRQMPSAGIAPLFVRDMRTQEAFSDVTTKKE